MNKRKWIVVFEGEGTRKLYRVEAVGYSQAITFAGDKLVREGEKREDWEPVRVDSLFATS